MAKRKPIYLPVVYQEVLPDGRLGRCFKAAEKKDFVWRCVNRQITPVPGERVPTFRTIVFVKWVHRLSELNPELPFNFN